MSHINFVIPQNKSELLNDNDEQYYVRNVVSVKEVPIKLREAKQCFKDEGPEFILDNFDTFYSILHHADTLQMDIIMKSYENLHAAVERLNNVFGFLLEDKDNLNAELNVKYLNVIKMLMYIYINTIILIEQKVESRRSQTLQKGRARKKLIDDEINFGCNKKMVLVTLYNIMDREINVFWDPPVVEETFVNMVGEVCYRFLEMPSLKSEKEMRLELFNMLGMLIKNYNHGMTFVVKIVQLIKIYEHLSHCVPEGIQLLVENYNCKSLVRDFVQEITEWQTDEKYQDVQGGRNCSAVLFEMANLMPSLMIPEVMYLSNYLAHDSYVLRNSVLHVITEVVLNVLTKPNLTEEEQESRDEFLSILEEHTHDVAALVRSKVFQHWAKLQQENAIPLKMQAQILEKAIMHLRDKAANVRKCAANCITTFLSYNIYGAKLQLNELEAELQHQQEILGHLKKKLEDGHIERLREAQEKWKSREKDLRDIISQKLKEETENISESQIAREQVPDIVRFYISEDKFSEAFEVCKNSALQELNEMGNDIDEEQKVDFYLMLMRTIVMDIGNPTSADKSRNKSAPTESDLEKLVDLENAVLYLNGAVNFLKLIDSALKPMANLLESTSLGDMQEAIEFFVTAYKFNINNSQFGVLEMLKFMQRNEEERKNLIIDAFKTIYLTTDSTTMKEHATIITDRLINLLQNIPYENVQDLNLIISEWVSNSFLDNSIIDMLWQYFTKKVEVDDEMSRASLRLLTMVAMGRKTIITKNVKVVSTIAFGERGQDDILLVKYGCEILQVVGHEKQDITDKNPPFRIKANDEMWKSLIEMVIGHFNKKSQFYNGMVSAAIECIYRLCSKPEKLCEELVLFIINSLASEMINNNEKDLYGYQITQCAHILGEISMKQLNFLDETVYKELKRRNHIREEHKSDSKKKNKKGPKNVQNASAARRATNSTNVTTDVEEPSIASTVDESTLEGAQADDTDAEFILNVLENNTVSESSGLGKLAYILHRICERPDIYDNLYIQGTTITAMMRYMLISSKFCQKYMQLIFTILEKTQYPEVKCNILIHCSDLLERFPNVIEPWTPRLYERLRDTCVEVRKAGFFLLANLILRDMIRVQGHISEMACCIVDEEEFLQDMSKHFFTQLAHKGNSLYNVLPDIFSHLTDNSTLTDTNFKIIMKFLFGLIDKNKQMENLVERFCSKFRVTENELKCCNIAYCLSLIQYNEKGLKNLLDGFSCYKNVLQIDEVYSTFKQIVNVCSKSTKNDIKEMANELDQKMSGTFEVDGPRNTPKPKRTPARPNVEKSGFKKPKGKVPKKKVRRPQCSDSDDSDEETSKENAPTKPLRRTQRNTPRKVVSNRLDFDSD